MSKPITRVLGRNVKGYGYVLVEKSGARIRIKQNGLINIDWLGAQDVINMLQDSIYKQLRQLGYEVYKKLNANPYAEKSL